MVAVYRVVPQAALRRLSHVAAHLASSTGQAHKAWSLTDQAGIHRGTTQGQWPACNHPPIHRASKGSDSKLPRELFSL